MSVTIQCERFVLSNEQVQNLWRTTILYRKSADDVVVIRCVNAEEIQKLNRMYRDKDTSTNVLTFSYHHGKHDVALCFDVVRKEAAECDVDLKDYMALVLVHAFLHVSGMDHDLSKSDERDMKEAENTILSDAGFSCCGILSVNGRME